MLNMYFLAQFVYESNMIESVDIPFEEILEELNHKMYNTHLGHVGAAVNSVVYAWNRFMITKEMIFSWQKSIIEEQNKRFKEKFGVIPQNQIGHYRTHFVSVGERLCPSPFFVPTLIKELLEQVNELQAAWPRIDIRNIKEKENLIREIADLHFKFEAIHPFIDGNGRTGRLLALYLFEYFSIKPYILFTHSDKFETYYPAFHSKEIMQKYFLQKSKD